MKTTFLLGSLMASVLAAFAAQPEPHVQMAKPPLEQPPVQSTIVQGQPVPVQAVVSTNVSVSTNPVIVTTTTTTTNFVAVTNQVLSTNYVPVQPVEDQRLYGSQVVLVTPQQARAVIDRFRTNYAKMGSPRMVIAVNRELVDEQAGMKLTARTEKTESSKGSISGDNASGTVAVTSEVKVSADAKAADGTLRTNKNGVVFRTQKASNENTYRIQERKDMTLADRQTVRDVERIFGRPLRMAGVSLADQRTATQIADSQALSPYKLSTDSDQARKDREVLKKVSDVAIEVLISSKNIQVQGISGDRTYSVPDIQATAIRLSDSKIIGQAASADLIGRGNYAESVARSYGTPEISEATVLALMEDILNGMGE
jgi:hypothetical protein